jgi:hypothetical protein
MKSKEVVLADAAVVRLKPVGSQWSLTCPGLHGSRLVAGEIKFSYRYILSGKEQLRQFRFDSFTEKKNGLTLHGSLPLNENESFPIDCQLTGDHQHGAGTDFAGLSFRFVPRREIPWALELVLEPTLALPGWRVFVQDLYTREKAAVIGQNWAGINHCNWQAERSPLDFAAREGKLFWGRLETLEQDFLSRATGAKDGKAVFQYHFKLASQEKKSSPRFSLLTAALPKSSRELDADIWRKLFVGDSSRFRQQAGVAEEPPLPLANLPIDGGTPGCAPKDKLVIRGKFNAVGGELLRRCEELNYTRLLVGSPWISLRTWGITAKCTRTVTYDSRCGIIDFEIAREFGGRRQFRDFCRKAHEKNIEVFAWYPGFHLSNLSPHVQHHPEWLIRKADGSPSTYVFFHLSILSPRPEVQDHFLKQLRGLKRDCEFDGLWLDSFNTFSFMDLDYSLRHGVSTCKDGIDMVRRIQELGFKVINEGYSPFGVRGDGEAMFYLGQEHMATDTSLFTYWKNVPEILRSGSFFRFLANRAPLTIPLEYVPKKYRAKVALWNRVYAQVLPQLRERVLLSDNQGVLWRDGGVEILFSYAEGSYPVASGLAVVDLMTGKKCVTAGGNLCLRKEHVYIIGNGESA